MYNITCSSKRIHVMCLCIVQVVETEASREALRKELANMQRKMAEFEDEARLKEKDYQLALEDSRRLEKKLDDQVSDGWSVCQ